MPNNLNSVKPYLPFLILVLLAVGFWDCSTKSSENARSLPDKSGQIDSVVVELGGRNGQSVFALTKDSHNLKYMGSSAGVFVSAIDGLESGHDYGWIYSVNDSIGQVASDHFITRDGDRIKWHFRKF